LDCYLKHFEKLCFGLKLLWKKNLTKSLAVRANRFLREFVKETKQLYGNRFLTIKFHSLLHATCSVLDFGPLGQISCIQAENVNGFLTRQLFGTRNFITQLINRFTVFTMLKTMFYGCVRDSKGRDVKETIVGKLLKKFGFMDDTDSAHWKQGKDQYAKVS
jgi:hypothetical protein